MPPGDHLRGQLEGQVLACCGSDRVRQPELPGGSGNGLRIRFAERGTVRLGHELQPVFDTGNCLVRGQLQQDAKPLVVDEPTARQVDLPNREARERVRLAAAFFGFTERQRHLPPREHQVSDDQRAAQENNSRRPEAVHALGTWRAAV